MKKIIFLLSIIFSLFITQSVPARTMYYFSSATSLADPDLKQACIKYVNYNQGEQPQNIELNFNKLECVYNFVGYSRQWSAQASTLTQCMSKPVKSIHFGSITVSGFNGTDSDANLMNQATEKFKSSNPSTICYSQCNYKYSGTYGDGGSSEKPNTTITFQGSYDETNDSCSGPDTVATTTAPFTSPGSNTANGSSASGGASGTGSSGGSGTGTGSNGGSGTASGTGSSGGSGTASGSSSDPASSGTGTGSSGDSGTGTGSSGGSGTGTGSNSDSGTGKGSSDGSDKTNNNGTTTGSLASNLPAFCSWATAVCDFVDSFNKDPELPDTQKVQIDELKIDSYQYQQHVQFGSTCPFQPESASISLGSIGAMNFTKDLTSFCDYARDARPFVIALGHLGALFFLIVGLRSQSNG